MIKDRKESKDEKYKQVYVRDINGERWYTQCFMNEDDYMNLSSVWQSIRSKKLAKNPVCEVCGAAYHLRIHHIRYPEIWGEEPLEDLMTVCDICHNKIHGKSVYPT